MGYLSDHPDWMGAYMSRFARMYERDKNYACIILWSLGNEVRTLIFNFIFHLNFYFLLTWIFYYLAFILRLFLFYLAYNFVLCISIFNLKFVVCYFSYNHFSTSHIIMNLTWHSTYTLSFF
jgi:Glycosyl hydrolases family 2, TIM barrel domain